MKELISEAEQVVEEVERKKELEAQTYGDRLRVFRTGFILLSGGISSVGLMIVSSPLMNELPYPWGAVVLPGSGMAGLCLGFLAGEALAIATAKISAKFAR